MNHAAVQWDDRKAAASNTEHGVSFDAARDLFKDPVAVDQVDSRRDSGEVRFTTIGMAKLRPLSVAYTTGGETILLISARAAEYYEQREYHEQNT